MSICTNVWFIITNSLLFVTHTRKQTESQPTSKNVWQCDFFHWCTIGRSIPLATCLPVSWWKHYWVHSPRRAWTQGRAHNIIILECPWDFVLSLLQSVFNINICLIWNRLLTITETWICVKWIVGMPKNVKWIAAMPKDVKWVVAMPKDVKWIVAMPKNVKWMVAMSKKREMKCYHAKNCEINCHHVKKCEWIFDMWKKCEMDCHHVKKCEMNCCHVKNAKWIVPWQKMVLQQLI